MTFRPAGVLRAAPFRLPAMVAVLAAAAGWPRGVARAADLFVTSADDTVNGDTSSPDALAAQPGPDGISLREAILAADNAPGPHRIDLSSFPAVQPLVLASDLPPITQDGISLLGPTGRAGEPLVTISGSPISVFASHFRAVRGPRRAGAIGRRRGRHRRLRIRRAVSAATLPDRPGRRRRARGPRLAVSRRLSGKAQGPPRPVPSVTRSVIVPPAFASAEPFSRK